MSILSRALKTFIQASIAAVVVVVTGQDLSDSSTSLLVAIIAAVLSVIMNYIQNMAKKKIDDKHGVDPEEEHEVDKL